MRRIFLALLFIIVAVKTGCCAGVCADFDYQQTYRELALPTFSYIHNIDPGQYYDCKDTTWSPYPLFRLNSVLYFKTIAIQPGYYNLTPREHKGNWFVLFKEAGFVKYIIPVYNRDFVPEYFYEENLPKPKLTAGQKFQLGMYDWIGKHFKSAKRKPAAQTYLEVTDLDNNFISIVVYYNEFRYHMILRTIQL